ncbi:MAG: DNA topoisomerase I [Alphaproteobacteria bacterium GWF2_58_20]|nr:MAG: DNA topoisomerase I [Alphaproteobacteria bacterium GWF2_58_20]
MNKTSSPVSAVVVESPAKAKTINKYLGPGYEVIASMGHIRDLLPKDGSVRPDEGFAMTWATSARAEKPLSAITKVLKKGGKLILATDPDREGEAISWHIRDVLAERGLVDPKEASRVTFNEITEKAIKEAFAKPRDLDHALVDAYLARRALDYLVGFNLSPVLWRKLPGSKSAGRVQSVALRLICEREGEIETFKTREYWTIGGSFTTHKGEAFQATLTHLDAKKLAKFDIPDETSAHAITSRLLPLSWTIAASERKPARRSPNPPFITSTLQQEASRKLGFSASRTMSVAQRLYEGVDIGGELVGLITYMRTDGTQISSDAVTATRHLIADSFGENYCPAKPRFFKSKVKNAQEAHEAIRPTDVFRRPESIAAHLERDELRLYELIWKRMVACQMADAILEQVSADIDADNGSARFHATGSTVDFDGFLKLYEEGRDETGEDEKSANRLPALVVGEEARRTAIIPDQHFTEPPPRYSEASLVKKLEELGIGRPSTYASIIAVLQEREYVRLEKKRFIPEDRGRIVTSFLEAFFSRYVEYNFTADLEEELDHIASGDMVWRKTLETFWKSFSSSVGEARELPSQEVLAQLDQKLDAHYFPHVEGAPDPRICPTCGTGRLSLRLSRYGAFIGCSNYPACPYTRKISGDGAGQEGSVRPEAKLLGEDPTTGKAVTLRHGPYGVYVQLGESEARTKGRKASTDGPRRTSLPKDMKEEDITLPLALSLLALPKTLGHHPETGEEVVVGIGRYGPFIRVGKTYHNIPAGHDLLGQTLESAITIASTRAQKKTEGREIGQHPESGAPVSVHEGRYGPYVKCGKISASLPRGMDPANLTMEEAVTLVAAKAEKGSSGKKPAQRKTTRTQKKK